MMWKIITIFKLLLSDVALFADVFFLDELKQAGGVNRNLKFIAIYMMSFIVNGLIQHFTRRNT